MNSAEARQLLSDCIAEYSALGYEELRGQLGRRQTLTKAGRSGATYQIQLEIFWDHQPEGAIRILGKVDDGNVASAIFPITDSTLVES